jgi:hypothetical protein
VEEFTPQHTRADCTAPRHQSALRIANHNLLSGKDQARSALSIFANEKTLKRNA